MSLIRLLSKPNSRLSSCTPSAAKIRPLPTCSHQEHHSTHRQRRCHHPDDTRRKDARARREVERRSVEDVFIRGLVAASTCRQHRKSLGDGGWRQSQRGTGCQSRSISFSALSRPRKAVEADAGPQISPKEYNDLVDIYPGFDKDPPPPVDDPPDVAPDSAKQRQHFPLASSLVLTPAQEHKSRPRRRLVRDPESSAHSQQLMRFVRLVHQKPGHVAHNRIWSTYEAIPAPRIPYLTDQVIYKAFRHLVWVEFKDAEAGAAMRRFFALLKDCITENVRLNDMVWNSAIAFSGRWMRRVTGEEVKAAVETWMQMEGAGYVATNVTFNILFDLAVRSGRYALADTIFGELQARKMPLNRYFRTSVIFYAGMKRDGDGVRKAFRQLVEAGEIVDTAVMNCVILSLLRAGEAPAAETVFARMIRLHEEKFGTLAPTDWRDMKELGGLLSETGEKLRRDESKHESSFFGGKYSFAKKREELQKAAPIAPNGNTYRILIKYHAYTSGDLPRIHALLTEMKEKEHNVHGSVYVHVLRGFAAHGGFAFSAWSRMSLENLWAEVVEVVGIKTLEANTRTEESTITISSDDQEEAPDPPGSASEGLSSEATNLSDTTYTPFGPPAEDVSDDGTEDITPDLPSSSSSSPPSNSPSETTSGPIYITDYDFSNADSSAQTTRSHPPSESLLPETQLPDPDSASTDSQEHSPLPVTTSELDRPTYMTPSLAIAAIDAFTKVTGVKRMQHVWVEIEASWQGANPEELERVQSVVDRHVQENSKYVDWEKSGWTRDGKGRAGFRNWSRM